MSVTRTAQLCLIVLAPSLVGAGTQPAPENPVRMARCPASLKAIQESDQVMLHGNVHGLLASAPLLGRPHPATVMNHLVLSLRMDPDAKQRLEALLKAQKDPASPLYHQWLTPKAFGEQFGATAAERSLVSRWLTSQGFRVDEIAPSGLSITFSGDVGKVERTFGTTMQQVLMDGQVRVANVTDPSIPRALAGLVQGVVSLHNIPLRPHHSDVRAIPAAAVISAPQTTSGGTHYLAPGDFSTIYNLNPLYTSGLDGSGTSVAVVGRCNININDVRAFRSRFNLPANDPVIIINGSDPGNLGGNEEVEADLDVQWAGAIAKKATIKFVVSASGYTDGTTLSSQYIVNNRLAPVLTISFGLCESIMGSTECALFNSLWSQAAAEGITVCVSSGDSGSSGCSPYGSGVAVSGLSSTPYNVCVGGTQFSDGTGNYWASTNNADGSSAYGYIPEVVWNQGSGATGGGVSQIYSKPSWQSAPGVPADGMRDVPDISFTSASHDAYSVYLQSRGGWISVGGTSAATPSFAGMMALLVQRTGVWQGNPNPDFYSLATQQYGAGRVTVFHDTVLGTNNIGSGGFNAGVGYDCATGLGSLDATAWVNSLGGTKVNLTSDKASPQVRGTTVTLTAAGSGGSGSYEFQFWLLPPNGTWTSVQAYSSNRTWAWNTAGLAAGTYNMSVWMRAAGTTPAAGYDVYGRLPYTLTYPAAAVSLAFDKSSPQQAGALLTCTALGSGGSGSYEYEFWVQPPGGDWSITRAFSSSATWIWNTTGLAAGTYNLSCWMRGVGTAPAAGYDAYARGQCALTVPQVSASISPASPQRIGTSIQFTAAGSGGGGSYEYEFWLLPPGGTWSIKKVYSSTATWAWNTTGIAAGTYNISVWMRSSGTAPAAGYDAHGNLTYTLTYPPVSATLTPSVSSPRQAGSPVTYTALGSGGSGSYEYEFWMQPPGGDWSITRAYASSPTWSWNSAGLAAGTYNVSCWVRSAGTAPDAGYDAYARSQMTLTVPQVTVSANLASPQAPGTSIPFRVAGSGGSGSYEYEFWLMSPAGVWTNKQAYSSSSSWTWNTAGLPAGAYTLSVRMRNAGTTPTAGYDTYVRMSYTLAFPPASVAVSSNRVGPQLTGTSVTCTATGSGGSGSYEYEFWLMSPAGTWSLKQAYSSAATWTWNTAGQPAGGYTLSVRIRNAGTTPSVGYDAYVRLGFTII